MPLWLYSGAEGCCQVSWFPMVRPPGLSFCALGCGCWRLWSWFSLPFDFLLCGCIALPWFCCKFSAPVQREQRATEKRESMQQGLCPHSWCPCSGLDSSPVLAFEGMVAALLVYIELPGALLWHGSVCCSCWVALLGLQFLYHFLILMKLPFCSKRKEKDN